MKKNVRFTNSMQLIIEKGSFPRVLAIFFIESGYTKATCHPFFIYLSMIVTRFIIDLDFLGTLKIRWMKDKLTFFKLSFWS